MIFRGRNEYEAIYNNRYYSVLAYCSRHILRLFFSWKVTINGMIVPIWLSVPGFLIASGLALMLWRESRK